MASALIYALQHQSGVELNADGWAYWQGAQSIADGSGYRYFSGDPIIAWPPLYSLYLSTWIKLLGSEAAVLTLANALLALAQGAAWTYLFRCLCPDERESPAAGFVAMYVALTIALYERSVLAHNLFYTIMPAFILACWKAMKPDGRLYVALSCVFAIALVESHISGVAYVAAAAFLFAVLSERDFRSRAADAFAVLAVPTAALIVTASWFGQIGGHPIEAGRFSFFETLSQISNGVGDFVLPHPARFLGSIVSIAILALMGIRSFQKRSRQTLFALAFCFISLSLLAVAFSITWLNGLVSESRHLLIVPLMVIPILLAYGLSSNALVMKAAALLVFVTPLERTLYDVPLTSQDFVPAYASISPLPGFGKTAIVDGKTLVGPIAWEEPEGGYSSSGAPRWGFLQARSNDLR